MLIGKYHNKFLAGVAMRIIIVSLMMYVFPLIATEAPAHSQEELDKRLVSAVRTDNVNWMRRLIVRGANPNSVIHIPGYLDRTILMEAIAHSKNPQVIKLLLDSGANPNYMQAPIGEPTRAIYSLLNRYMQSRQLAWEECIVMLSYLLAAGAIIDEFTQQYINVNNLTPLVERARKYKIP